LHRWIRDVQEVFALPVTTITASRPVCNRKHDTGNTARSHGNTPEALAFGKVTILAVFDANPHRSILRIQIHNGKIKKNRAAISLAFATKAGT
jgi:hypothetical protein